MLQKKADVAYYDNSWPYQIIVLAAIIYGHSCLNWSIVKLDIMQIMPAWRVTDHTYYAIIYVRSCTLEP